MSWIGRKIYQYLKECEEFKKDLYGAECTFIGEKSDTSNPTIHELPFFKHTPPVPEREPFENFKNNRKKMKKNLKENEQCIISSVNNDGIVTITIEPKKGFAIGGFDLNVTSGEIPKVPVLPKELLNPNPELQAQFDILAKLITTMDYYNGHHNFHDLDMVAVIRKSPYNIVVDGMERFNCKKAKLFFKDIKTAMKFLENFRKEIESVNHLI